MTGSAPALADALARAVAEGGLTLRYQPKFDLFRRRVTGAEALVRWHHPVLGPLSPATFIPVAEAAGLITALGDWVLRQACLQAAAWREAGTGLTVAVNVSPHQLAPEAGLEETVASALAVSGLPPQALELEVTEGVLMHAPARRVLDRLMDRGLGVALDDFGTGYSSLAYLRHVRARTLKIDKSFIDGLPASLADCALVEAVIRLAHSFGMAVVAEGVETQEQMEVLDLMGCDAAQGFAIARPLPGMSVIAHGTPKDAVRCQG